MKKNQFTKAVCSVSEMAAQLELSRARFYQLIEAGILPQPIYDIRTKRPYYDQELQEQCLQVRATGIGVNGQYVLFYSPRKQNSNSPKRSVGKKVSKHQELADTITAMGLEVSVEQVESALNELYPQGSDGEDQGVVVREVFRFLKKRSSN